MNPKIRFSLLSLPLIAAFAAFGLAGAQDGPAIDPKKLALARQVVDATKSGRPFDEVLPTVADEAKMTFIRSNPQMQLGVIDVVDRVALNLVGRRAALDNRFAEIWASGFTEEELQAILEFYKTPVGQKLADLHPRILGAHLGAAQAWSRALSEEMLQKATAELDRMVDQENRQLEGGAQPAPAPAAGGEAAPSGDLTAQ